MKNSATLLDFWEIGNFRGRNRAVGIVTVEPGWQLQTIEAGDVIIIGGGGPDPKGPYRYFQNTEGAVTEEIEIPNIKSIEIDRSVDTDAASCRITMYNQWHDVNNVTPSLAGQLGQPGYFTANRGLSSEAAARWNHTVNAWGDVIVPNALLRTYQGYGGYDIDGTRGDRATLLDNGNITITGTWLIDRITVDSRGTINIECRDTAKLLMDQILYIPLVPSNQYPAKFYRWKSTNFDPNWGDTGAGGGGTPSPNVPMTYFHSSSDILLGATNSPILGHLPSDAVDGIAETYALGFGWNTSNGVEVLDWWEFAVGQQISQVWIAPLEGPYTAYISVMVGGVWQGSSTVPFTAVPFNDPAIPGDGNATDAIDGAVPYVTTFGTRFESGVPIGEWHDLPTPVTPDRIRVSFRNLPLTTITPRSYRSGIKEVNARLMATTPAGSPQAASALVRHTAPTPANGYRIVDQFGAQFSFGTAASNLTENSTTGSSSQTISGVAHPTQNGFWTVETNGRVHSFGAATTHPLNGVVGATTDATFVGVNDFVDIAVTNTGNGYWLLRRSGGVYTFGDAQYLSGTYNGSPTIGEIPSQTPITDTGMCIAGDPNGMGYWIVSGSGKVAYFGTAPFNGELTPPLPADPARACSIEPTPSSAGYWIMYTNGQLFHYGDATPFPDPPIQSIPWAAFIRGKTDDPLAGAWALRTDGYVYAFGDAENFGNPTVPGGVILTDGNIRDYSDIVKELCMWAGFALPDPNVIFGSFPAFHGNIETTGAWAEQPITEDIFDKRPVIDPSQQIKELVGFQLRITEEGGVIFDSPNWWAPGNFYEDGSRTAMILEIDERQQLFEYSYETNDTDMRSQIMITNALPNDSNDSTITTRFTPPGQNILRGMVRPAIWSNEIFSKASEQQVMAELIALHIWFTQRQGTVTCYANPIIQLDDQVRIWERTTAESYIHYVRGINTTMDLDSGEYIANITTHWLGSEAEWVIEAPTGTSTTTQNNKFKISPQVLEFLGLTGSQAAAAGISTGFSGVI